MGSSCCQRLRTTSDTPVIMLSAMADHTDRVAGLKIGADDYLTRPFDQRELRSGDQSLVLLSSGEFDLLLAFSEHPQRVMTQDQLMDLARGSTYAGHAPMQSISVRPSPTYAAANGTTTPYRSSQASAQAL